MPHIIDANGQAQYVPGVYISDAVSSSSPGPLPAFQIPVLLARGWEGHGYDADAKSVANETKPTPFKLVKTDTYASTYYGEECDIHRIMRYAKRHGLPFAYVANLSPLTRAAIIADTVTTDIEQFTLYARVYGPARNWAKIKFASGVFTTIPVKRYALLSASVTSKTRLYLEGSHPWLIAGAAITVGSNIVAGSDVTVLAAGSEITATGQRAYWIEISGSGVTIATTDYAMVLQYDTDSIEDSTGTSLTTSQKMIDYFNNYSKHWLAVKHANWTDAVPAAIATSTPIKEVTAWGTVTKGAAPAPTSSDVTAFLALMNGGQWAAFAIREQVIPQCYYLGMSDSTSHGLMRDYAAAEKTRGWPIAVLTGCAWGDTSTTASDTTNPGVRAAALNNEHVGLAANGAEKEAAFITRGPAIWGRMVQGGPNHNLTNDEFAFSEDEVQWNEIDNGQLTYLLKHGVLTNKLSVGSGGIRYRVAHGISTLQANDGAIWNETDATTAYWQQRNLADFVDRVVNVDFEERAVGGESIDRNALVNLLRRRAQKSLVKKGYVEDFIIVSLELNDAANGWDLEWSPSLPKPVDYITVKNTIRI